MPSEPAFDSSAPYDAPPVRFQSVPSAKRYYYLVGGSITFGLTYTLTALAGATMNAENEGSGKNLFIPVAGPLVHMFKTEDESAKEALAFSCALQAIGAVAIVVGLATPKTESVPVYGARVRLTPIPIGKGGGGLGLVGTF